MKTILLVEDDPFILDIYANQFRKEGYRVDVAKDGQMALEKIKNSNPDLLVLDINLPKIDGWQLLKMVRDNIRTKDLKVVIISNNNPSDFADNISHLKVMKYFVKIESTPEEVVSAIKEILK
ncbi:MAG: Response regulator receiver [Parcubacteria group bacterium GW2011_GWA1_33_6]|uniref:Response regulatory domain-containing protein n=1 Tax=Candidatus Staskawiczbacteria bacterium RIFCSPHIGHO2_02_FULL_33_16 TaxID=1802204 RepID=A0A1G2HY76_9BACT|nr:MAG: Response regulator receiver [Parcubacteria group bacterium GW2011_GWA2_33_14]KKP54182.1 MAG: Response regulator receiver [Parcubacteria group bacterium GW2011_GWA1_33_6]OGZ67433.1 MAG: hypothetical protein A3D34_02215 [Candidatus Staskawiczbacteria bacterium RIFCSPHIGHO2_02_FULL_33_16]OGZ70970.1 MAG: hypothetical protein A2980_03110 [Candidatus Staskawiczbacteria bacterium RIFCSPLOWO2_01_FULL_33_13]